MKHQPQLLLAAIIIISITIAADLYPCPFTVFVPWNNIQLHSRIVEEPTQIGLFDQLCLIVGGSKGFYAVE